MFQKSIGALLCAGLLLACLSGCSEDAGASSSDNASDFAASLCTGTGVNRAGENVDTVTITYPPDYLRRMGTNAETFAGSLKSGAGALLASVWADGSVQVQYTKEAHALLVEQAKTALDALCSAAAARVVDSAPDNPMRGFTVSPDYTEATMIVDRTCLVGTEDALVPAKLYLLAARYYLLAGRVEPYTVKIHMRDEGEEDDYTTLAYPDLLDQNS